MLVRSEAVADPPSDLFCSQTQTAVISKLRACRSHILPPKFAHTIWLFWPGATTTGAENEYGLFIIELCLNLTINVAVFGHSTTSRRN